MILFDGAAQQRVTEAAANLLANPQLDPMGKIAAFKFCAAKVEPVREGVLEAAE